ncbi:unnamed protein product [Closterium sp. NIES-54]
MVTSPDAGTSGAQRRHRRIPSTPPVARPSPRPVMPTPSASTSDAADRECSESPRRPLPQVRVPVFPQSSRPQGKKKRVQDAETPSPRHRMTKRAWKAYTAKEKLYWLKMIDAQPDLSVHKLASLAKVQPKQIHDWKRLKKRLEIAAGCRRRLSGAGRKPKWPMMETAVYRRFLSHRGKGLPVSVGLLQSWVTSYMKHRHPQEKWRSSHRWTKRFRRRWSLAQRVKTKIGQKLAADCKKKCNSFWEFVRQMRVLNAYPLNLIVNTDQTPLFFEMPAERTLEMKGVVIRVQGKGWMDEKLVQDWTTQVLVPFLKPLREEGGQRKEALLILDSYRGHTTEVVGQTMKLFKLTRAVIPGGCTRCNHWTFR